MPLLSSGMERSRLHEAGEGGVSGIDGAGYSGRAPACDARPDPCIEPLVASYRFDTETGAYDITNVGVGDLIDQALTIGVSFDWKMRTAGLSRPWRTAMVRPPH
jgi:hypothetical protein